MTLFLVIFLILLAVVAVRVLHTFRVEPAPLGRMSERWLADFRASSQA